MDKFQSNSKTIRTPEQHLTLNTKPMKEKAVFS